MDEDPHPSRAGSSRRRGRDAGGTSSGLLVLSDEDAHVGDVVTIKGRNFPAGAEFDLLWHSVAGEWGVLEGNEIVGPQYRPRTDHLATVTADESGRFDEQLEVPADYGGSHAIELQDGDGETVDEAELSIHPWFELDRTEAPLGETFRVTGYGLGPNVVRNNYQIAWDNGFVGFVTGVQNRGTATAEVRAVGPPGEHVLQVWRNYRGVPFLQGHTQSPYGDVGGDRQSAWTVEVAPPEGDPPAFWVDGLLDEQPLAVHYPDLDEATDAELTVTPTSGQAGTEATVAGRNFPPDTEVDLVWHTHEGSYRQGIPVTTQPRPDVLPTVVTDADGAFEFPFEVPRSRGSTRPVTAEVDGRSVAVTGFVVQPSVERFEPRSGPVGTEIEIELAGLGWTTFETNYHLVYDNKPLGYVSGTSGEDTDSTVRTTLLASGEPGYHFIDLYPSIFDMQDDDPDFELKPHLSYVDNHPVRPMPAMHMAFEVTE